MTRAVLDTSVLVRYLTRDDPAKAEAARALVAKADDDSLHFPGEALAELCFVLLRVYRWPRDTVAAAIRAVVTNPAIDVPDPATWLDVADDLESGRGLIDAYLLRTTVALGATTLYTYDDDIKPMPGVTCRQP